MVAAEEVPFPRNRSALKYFHNLSDALYKCLQSRRQRNRDPILLGRPPVLETYPAVHLVENDPAWASDPAWQSDPAWASDPAWQSDPAWASDPQPSAQAWRRRRWEVARLRIGIGNEVISLVMGIKCVYMFVFNETSILILFEINVKQKYFLLISSWNFRFFYIKF